MSVQIEILTGAEARLVDPRQIAFPDDSVVFYARENGEIVGQTSIIELPHLEGTTVREDKRGTRLAAQLVAAAEETLRSLGRSYAFAFVLEGDVQVADYLNRFGYSKFPVVVYCKNLMEAEQEEAA